METHILNYRIIIEPEKLKTGKIVYNALCPTLDVVDWGNSVEKATEHIKEAIECHVEFLVKHNRSIPNPDQQEFMITSTAISLPKEFLPSFI